jgi:hypothetical protein
LPASAVAGAPAARKATVVAFQLRAYNAGADAPQSDFNGNIFRSGNVLRFDNTLDANRNSFSIAPSRYNVPGQGRVYTSPSTAENIGEMTACKSNMEGNSMLESNLNLSIDENGHGGMADIRSGLKQQGINESALVVPKGAQEIPPLYKALGNIRIRCRNKWAKAPLMQVRRPHKTPSATGGSRIDVISRNANPASITPHSIIDYDASGNPGAARNAASIKAMSADTTTLKPGLAQDSIGKDGKLSAPRGGNNVRYGAVMGAAVSLISDGVRAARGDDVNGLEVAGNATLAVGTGATAVKATEALAPKMA